MSQQLTASETTTTAAVIQGLQAAITAWLAGLDVAPLTKDAYQRAIWRFHAYLGEHLLDGSSRAHVLAYKAHLVDHYTPNTVTAYLTPVRRFYQWLHAETGSPDIAAGIKGGKKPRGFRKDALTVVQARSLLAVGDDSLTGLRDRALLALMVTAGLRVVEVARATVGDLQAANGHLTLHVWGKGRDEADEAVVVTATAETALNAYLAARSGVEDASPLFASTSRRNWGGVLTPRSVSRIVKNRLREIGVDSPRVTAHSLRHTAVTFALVGGASLQEAQAMARHAQITTTQVYAHNLERWAAPAENRVEVVLGGVSGG